MTDRPTEPRIVICRSCRQPITYVRVGPTLTKQGHAETCTVVAGWSEQERTDALHRHARLFTWRAIRTGVAERSQRHGHAGWVLIPGWQRAASGAAERI